MIIQAAKSILFSLQFLTVLPIRFKKVDKEMAADSLIFFPLSGAVIGLLLILLFNALFICNFSFLTIDIIVIIALVILTGGIHLDGLSDTFDAFFSAKKKEEILLLMRDPHAGVMGTLAVISVLLLKIGLLYSADFRSSGISLFLMCVLSRWAIVLLMCFFPYARKEGKAKEFIEGAKFNKFVLSTFLCIVLVFVFSKTTGLIIMAFIGLVTYFFGKFSQNKIGGITGDIIGATNEINEVLVLLSINILERIN